MSDRLVVNASPLIFLSGAGRLDLLGSAGAPVIVPRAVAEEVGRFGASDATAIALRETRWLQVVNDTPVPPSVLAWDLGPGESAVIAWALENPPASAVMDDLDGRRCARAHRLRVRGTLGLVLDAKRAGRVTSARSLMEQLRAAGMYLSDAVMNMALAEVGE